MYAGPPLGIPEALSQLYLNQIILSLKVVVLWHPACSSGTTPLGIPEALSQLYLNQIILSLKVVVLWHPACSSGTTVELSIIAAAAVHTSKPLFRRIPTGCH